MLLREVHLDKPAIIAGLKGSRFSADGPQRNVDVLDYRIDLFAVVAIKDGKARLVPLSNVVDCELLDGDDVLKTEYRAAKRKAGAAGDKPNG